MYIVLGGPYPGEVDKAKDIFNRFFDQISEADKNLEKFKSIHKDINNHLDNKLHTNKEYRRYLLNALHVCNIVICKLSNPKVENGTLRELAKPVIWYFDKKPEGERLSEFDLKIAAYVLFYSEGGEKFFEILRKIAAEVEKQEEEGNPDFLDNLNLQIPSRTDMF